MAHYRAIVEHVRYWRGAVHRWSTSYEFAGAGTPPPDVAACHLLLTADDKMCWGNGLATNGGTNQCRVYDLGTGGVPIAIYTAFDWENPASWVTYGGGAWGSVSSFEHTAEVALLVEWAGGLSRTGKKVNFRKWYHAVPSTSPVGGAVDVIPANVTSLQTQAAVIANVWNAGYGLVLGQPSRFAGAATVQPYYGNHQMPRGRRRKALVTASGRYTGPSIEVPSTPELD